MHIYFPHELNKDSKFKKDNTLCVSALGKMMEVFCYFGSIVSNPLSYDWRDKCKSIKAVPLSLCMKDVTGYRSTWCFSRIKSEAELIFAPAGTFCTESKYVSALNICPFHCSELGIGWQRNCYFNACQVPEEISNHIKWNGKSVLRTQVCNKNPSQQISSKGSGETTCEP